MKRIKGLALLVQVCVLAGCMQSVPSSTPHDAPQDKLQGSGEEPGLLGGLFATSDTRDLPAPLARARLARGAVVVAGPDGYCVDPVTLGKGTARHFAVIASCNILTGGAAKTLVEPLMMTVTVAPGRYRALPVAGQLADEVGQTLLYGDTTDGLVLAHLGGGGATVLEGGDPKYWRAAFLQGNRLVGLALYAPRDSPAAGPAGAEMLRAARGQIAALSPRPDTVPEQVPVLEQAAGVGASTAVSLPVQKQKSRSFFGRLFAAKDLR